MFNLFIYFDAGNATTNEDAAARDRIVHSVIQMHINSHDYTAKDLYQILLSNIKKKVNITGLRDSEQFSLLHEVVARDRAELITVFYDLGFISEMHRLRVTDRQSAYFDMTPLAMAEHDRKRCRDELEACIQKDKKLTKLCRIARKGDFAKLKTHVERKPEDVLYLSEGDCTYPIYWACVANSKPCIDYLIQNGANFDVSTKDGEKILTKIVSLGHIELVQYLIRKYHLDPNQTGLKHKTPLERAAETGDYPLFKILLRYGVTLENVVLHAAARAGQVNFIQKLMESHSSRLNVNGRDPANRTPLHHAADNSHVTTIQVGYGMRENKNGERDECKSEIK